MGELSQRKKRPGKTGSCVPGIDDDKPVLPTVAGMFEDAGSQITMHGNGRAGFPFFRKGDPALALTNIIMPEQESIGAIVETRRARLAPPASRSAA